MHTDAPDDEQQRPASQLMSDLILSYEPHVRFGVFAAVLAAVVLWETLRPRRRRLQSRRLRWTNNLAIAALNTLAVRFLIPVAAVGVAVRMESIGWGLFHWVDGPAWLEIPIAVLILDLLIYAQHVLFHAVPVFWRLHRMHHADQDFDVTTGIRFHPVEILLSAGIKIGAVALLGPAALAVVIFEILLNATSLFNHANASLPERWDRSVRLLLVTPDMHRVHHSVLPTETNSNFGFNLPWWDRLFGTYRARPAAGYHGMTVGLERFRTDRDQWLDRLLLQPLDGLAGVETVYRSKP